MVETTSRIATGVALLVAMVAGVDAGRGQHWDQLAMLVVIAVLLAGALALTWLRPPSVVVRADVATWLRDEAARTDDTTARVADRALALYRSSRTAVGDRPSDTVGDR